METVQTERPTPPPTGGKGRRVPSPRERRCLVTRESLPTERLIRFVVSPGGALVPDIEERLPGRGLWLTAARDIVSTACRKRVFGRAARGAVAVDDQLADIIEQLLVRRCLSLLGIARRAGEAVAGFEKVREMIRGGRAGLMLFASDGAADGRRKIEAAARGASGGAVSEMAAVDVFSSEELGGIFGRGAAVNVAVAEGAICARLLTECNRLAGFRPAKAE